MIHTPVREKRGTFAATVLQWLRPNRRERPQITDLPAELEPLYEAMMAAGCRLEAEMLDGYRVFLTVSDPYREEDLDVEIVPNGPQVQAALMRMLERRSWERRQT